MTSTHDALEVAYRPLDCLKANPKNARTHSKTQIRQIADSIRAFGFNSPILIDSNNIIVAGHGRAAAAKLIGIDQVPTIRLEGLTNEQIRAYLIADNRIAEKAGWDTSILAIEFQNLMNIEPDFDITVTGFEISEIDLIIDENSAKPVEDDVLDADEVGPAVTKPGDLWLLGKHRILCGNALEPRWPR